jgi:hypothetical protein
MHLKLSEIADGLAAQNNNISRLVDALIQMQQKQ